MYTKGELQFITRSDTENIEGDYDSRAYERVASPYVKLPHSCDSWVIGGEPQIRALLDDLHTALLSIEEST